jgi:methylenetetrahydrofolate dehydrogenase (NADP+)/methenyltetrahydrofolate cyclohydrolase
MTARILDGKSIADTLIQDIQREVSQRQSSGQRIPGLAVILLGADPASSIYVRNKRRACAAAGVLSVSHDLPASTSQAELLALITQLNDDPTVDGILVQAPLPEHIDDETVVEAIRPDKDVDGFHPYNIGRLAVRLPTLRSCTPYGVMRLLQTTGETLRGKHAVVVGASNHVGRPMALELLLAGCTVTVCHSATQDLAGHVGQADEHTPRLAQGVNRKGVARGDEVLERGRTSGDRHPLDHVGIFGGVGDAVERAQHGAVSAA